MQRLIQAYISRRTRRRCNNNINFTTVVLSPARIDYIFWNAAYSSIAYFAVKRSSEIISSRSVGVCCSYEQEVQPGTLVLDYWGLKD